jgi:hypothetical protein
MQHLNYQGSLIPLEPPNFTMNEELIGEQTLLLLILQAFVFQLLHRPQLFSLQHSTWIQPLIKIQPGYSTHVGYSHHLYDNGMRLNRRKPIRIYSQPICPFIQATTRFPSASKKIPTVGRFFKKRRLQFLQLLRTTRHRVFTSLASTNFK